MINTLIIFAKEPDQGNVKTRLRGCLSEKDRVKLYKAFVQDMLTVARKTKNTRKILAFSPEKTPRYLKCVAEDFEIVKQKGRTLGERMYNAFSYANGTKAGKTIIIGTDSPTLPASLIKKAFTLLTRKNIVIGPSADGGYYLIGMKEPRKEIFKGVRWSSASVLKKTIANAESKGLSIALVDEWYDVDDRKGLERLKKDLAMLKDKNTAVNTHRYFEGRE